MVKPVKIDIQTVELFDPAGNSLGFLNEYEFTDLRAQIKEEQAEGYYLVFDGEKIIIENNGRLKSWPNNLFRELTDSYDRLLF